MAASAAVLQQHAPHTPGPFLTSQQRPTTIVRSRRPGEVSVAKKRDGSATAVSKAEIAALSKKLDKWSATLPANEQALLQMIVGKGSLVDAESVRVAQTKQALADSVVAVFQDIGKVWSKDGWARIDPIWYKSDAIPQGEEVEITAKVQLKRR
jgi:hypothetical protein